MKAICWECSEYCRQEQLGDYTFRCCECGAENDKNDLHHSTIGPDEWCGVETCPKCKGYDRSPYQSGELEPETSDDVEEIINDLLRQGLSPGQAWAYYGVEVRGHSRNEWSKKCGYSDHSAVSEPLRKAKEKMTDTEVNTAE